MTKDHIIIKGARVNNLKNIDLKIPKNKLTVITGLSGSGKSSLAFDTIFAEGQRRYIESLSNFAKQFLGTIPKPDVDHIENLSPAISIDQKSTIRSPRSTVATMSDIYDYFRLLYTRGGVISCSKCNAKMIKKIVKNPGIVGRKDKSAQYFCPNCSNVIADFNLSSFSFNTPEGACADCRGLGKKMVIDPELVMPNPRLTLAEGAIRPWARSTSQIKGYNRILETLAKKYHFNLDTPIGKLSAKIKELLFYGIKDNKNDKSFEGIIKELETKYHHTDSEYVKKEIKKYMVETLCPTCHGARLKPESLAVKFANLNIFELCKFPVSALKNFLAKELAKIKSNHELIVPILKEIITRLGFLEEVGLGYLTLERNSITLSGGEAQRIRLATQLGSYLTGVIYILDEPSIGLHSQDQENLINVFYKLRDLGNTVIVVEHDLETMKAADNIVDLGPGAGEFGGEIVASGIYNEILKSKKSLTAKYLRGDKVIVVPARRRISTKNLIIKGATEHNLKNIDVNIPLNTLTCVTGVSGSGKSTLVNDILAKYLKKKFYKAKTHPGACKAIVGTQFIDKVIVVDQSSIGKTPRSNPVTYTGIFSLIREIYTELPQAKSRRYATGHFSFNVVGGRCEACKGDGVLKFEMYFLPDAYVTCPVCNGMRYNKEILDIYYKPENFIEGKNIAQILEMTVTEALKFFTDHPLVRHKLEIMEQVGLGYIRLGQSATTLSGGESQRIKLAAELARKDTNKTLYILDEPTTGLHFEDINKLLKLLQALVDKGNTVLVIEHNMDVIKSADYVIDLGPEGGIAGGRIMAEGTPEKIIKSKASITGKFLNKVLKK